MLRQQVYYNNSPISRKNALLQDEDLKVCIYEKFSACSSAATKKSILQSFTQPYGLVRVMVATVAFGVGLDSSPKKGTVTFALTKVVYHQLSRNCIHWARDMHWYNHANCESHCQQISCNKI